jgi:hypothetical protein
MLLTPKILSDAVVRADERHHQHITLANEDAAQLQPDPRLIDSRP